MEHPQAVLMKQFMQEQQNKEKKKINKSVVDPSRPRDGSAECTNSGTWESKQKLENKNNNKWTDLAKLSDVLPFISNDDWSKVVPNVPAGYEVYNPSIIQHPTNPDQFLINFRTANYEILLNPHRYLVRKTAAEYDQSHVQTLNFMATMSSTHSKKEFHHLGKLKTPPMPYPYPHIGGWEDIRLQAGDGKLLYATFTSLEITPNHMPAISLAKIDLSTMTASAPVRLVGLRPPSEKEKNWMSFLWPTKSGGEELHFIYSINPLVVMKANVETGECPVIFNQKNSKLPNSWRGSSPLVHLPSSLLPFLPKSDGKPKSEDIPKFETKEDQKEPNKVKWFISLAHTSDWPKYAQLFLVFRVSENNNQKINVEIMYHSQRFVFETHDIEYSLGLALTSDEKEFVMPYSIRDQNCRCLRFSPQLLLSQLLPTF